MAILVAMGLLMGSFMQASQAQGRMQRPNIVVILVDDLGYGDLECYGAPDLRSPAINELVGSGVRFDNFYANCPVCSPTRASLLTGRYPDLVGVPGVIRTNATDNWGYFSPSSPTLPSTLKNAGYETAMVGKWHLGLDPENHPIRRGFTYFKGFLGDMMDDYYLHRRHGIEYMRDQESVIRADGHATDLFTQWAMDSIHRLSQFEAPYFLYLAYNAPHTPIQPPADWIQKVRNREPEITDRRARLVALIEHLDEGIGKVVQAIRNSGDLENTLIIFTSDNGGQLDAGARNGNLRGGKQDLYEGGIKVPMTASWPGHIPAGSKSHAIGLTMDLFPTLCEAAGVRNLHQMDGSSLLREFLKPGGNENSRWDERLLFWMRREGNNRFQGQDYYAVRRGPWKLLQNNPFQELELYNLSSDPLEQNNVASDHRDIFNSLASELRLHIQRAGAVPWQRSIGSR